jgi:hypothetical protein
MGHQKRLLTTIFDEVLRHAGSLLGPPDGTPFSQQPRRDPERVTRRLVAKLEALGHRVMLEGAATG